MPVISLVSHFGHGSFLTLVVVALKSFPLPPPPPNIIWPYIENSVEVFRKPKLVMSESLVEIVSYEITIDTHIPEADKNNLSYNCHSQSYSLDELLSLGT